ncbi:biliverdin-producing heme oxygenase [Sphingomonas radiodurans]|uniref:biliverdin-producing heme oxygenase n=1 Tax=Sphingomonas radiodurans TaxID=2890321 RepID=UPI001E3F66DE|nr:biliverdin-producing heme oxygenase [Sphingomonas radiodurans]WBH16040.1 biliverdin-producing heme oxygenase [Sphingomonas radiodurans]
MSATSLLRSRTAPAHEAVDGAFAEYDLADRASYSQFLVSHARALPLAEAMAVRVWPALRPRTPLLLADCAALGVTVDVPAEPIEQPRVETDAEHWGALYVVEGSRLGGGMLAGRVGEGLPRAYLAATHQQGEWRAIRQAIDAAADGQDEAWHDALVAGALTVFGLYAMVAVRVT